MDFKWEKLKQYLWEYRSLHNYKVEDDNSNMVGRYCIAISVDDLLEVMHDIEEEYNERS